ncbi:MAG: AhpC/TSA family protein, partial [Crocinitomicaceae bacterium]|nr:AhpC/TSA family protein [Crocinitomicaceae bacterium]
CNSSNAKTDSGKLTTDTLGTAIPFTNGITDANKGMKHGSVEVKGSIQIPSYKKMYLWSVYGRTNSLIDSTDITNGNFSFGKKEFDQGIYMMGVSDNNFAPVIINPAEKVVEINFRSGRMDMNASSAGSRENEAWFIYQPKEAALLKAIRDAKVGGAKSQIKYEFEKQVAQKEKELAELRAAMISQYPNTHFAKILTWKQEPAGNDKQKYWENIDFTDHSIIHGLFLSDRIQNFMRTFSGGKEAGFIDCVSVIADKAKADDLVLEFALNQMLVGFYESGMENISTYIIDNYVNGDACGDADLSNIIKSTAESITRLAVGKTPPNITGNSFDGSRIDAMKIAAAKKYTLIMFWSSWCEHCKAEAPEIKTCYDQWKSKGFEIIGYSVDIQKPQWEAAIKERGFTFPNLCGMKLWDSPSAKDYLVTKTPGFFLIDHEGKIALKPKSIREVQAFLLSNIK